MPLNHRLRVVHALDFRPPLVLLVLLPPFFAVAMGRDGFELGDGIEDGVRVRLVAKRCLRALVQNALVSRPDYNHATSVPE